MPRGVMRRPAAAEESPKKKAKADPLAQIASELENATALSQSLRTMLASNLLSSLGVSKDERHEFQVSFVDMVGESLLGVEQDIQRQIADAEATLGGADAEKVNREATQQSAEATLSAKQEDVVQKKTVLVSDAEALEASNVKLKEAKASQKTGDKDLANAAKDKEAIEAVLAENYNPMKGGEIAANDPKAKANMKALSAFVKKGKFDTAMWDAVSLTLNKPMSGRGVFDGIVLQQFEDAFTQRIASFTAVLVEGEPAKAQREELVQAAQAENDAARQKHETSLETLNNAEAEEAVLTQALQEAKEAVTNLLPEIEEAGANKESFQLRLAAFREGPLKTFANMKDPPAPVEEAAEEPAMEAGSGKDETDAGTEHPLASAGA